MCWVVRAPVATPVFLRHERRSMEPLFRDSVLEPNDSIVKNEDNLLSMERKFEVLPVPEPIRTPPRKELLLKRS